LIGQEGPSGKEKWAPASAEDSLEKKREGGHRRHDSKYTVQAGKMKYGGFSLAP